MIYPNPVTENLTIEFDYVLEINTNLVVYDLTGRKVMEKTLNQGDSKFILNVSGLDNGVYFYKFDSNKCMKGKIIINN